MTNVQCRRNDEVRLRKTVATTASLRVTKKKGPLPTLSLRERRARDSTAVRSCFSSFSHLGFLRHSRFVIWALSAGYTPASCAATVPATVPLARDLPQWHRLSPAAR